ncbi:MAG TPA: zf-HC2 domain-containing protein [Candidatus Acidoferrales bacterium]|nr:zf-HC2 domain-containing protein [Candidatus Acidoferrales bacterium]
MNCHEAARHLPGYLDGGIEAQTQYHLREHLDSCYPCRRESEQYRLMSRALANLDSVAPPADLALQIRIRASKAPWKATLHRIRSRVSVIFDNILAPLAIPATGGVLTALCVFVFILQSMLVGVPMGVVENDLPLNFVQPAYLESLGPIPAPTFEDGLTLEATVNARGQEVDYRILSGPSDSGVTRQLDQMLLLSRFRPRLTNGQPTNGGHVVLNFNAIRVRG